MESKVGMVLPIGRDLQAVQFADTAAVHLVKPIILSAGISVSRLVSGGYAICVHHGAAQAIVEVTEEELHTLIKNLIAYLDRMEEP